MGLRADTPGLRLALASLLIALAPGGAHADEVAFAAGPGLLFSKHYRGYFLNYYRDVTSWNGRAPFLGLSAGGWPGEAQASIVAASLGLRGSFAQHGFWRASLGGGYIDHTTEHLGTHGEFMIQLLAGREFGDYDLAAGLIHVSNGDYLFHDGKPNDGENFLVAQLGVAF
ncbi:MAG TPA: acyloxyacyl hydrolase [Burkholderiales bacterium]|nr:acyloxyacyl hydrolase [Burkholderiales bacterium]